VLVAKEGKLEPAVSGRNVAAKKAISYVRQKESINPSFAQTWKRQEASKLSWTHVPPKRHGLLVNA
jgi:hypothetical protein